MPYSDTVPIEGFTATVGTTPLAEKLKKDRFVLDEIDWFWRNFMSDDGKGHRQYRNSAHRALDTGRSIRGIS